MRTLPGRRRAATGVATIEVLVAVTIVLLVGTIGIISFGGNDRGLVQAEAASAAMFLQETRMRGLELGRPIEIILSAEDRTLLAGGATHVFGRDVTIAPDEARVILQPSGESNGLTVTLGKGGRTASVSLDWLTGRVVIQ